MRNEIEDKMTEKRYCNKPDRHVPTLKCGFPLPCPWHTVIVDVTGDVPVIVIPDDANIDKKQSKRIKDIVEGIK